MANSRYIKGQRTGALPEYLDQELRRIEMMFLPLKWIPVTFQNAWVDYALGGHQTAQYSIGPDNWVHIRGLIKNGTFANPAFTLPVGFRPPAILLFSQCSTTGAAETYCRVDVQADGQVIPRTSAGGATNAYVSVNIDFYIGV